jgi:hypothetical protein
MSNRFSRRDLVGGLAAVASAASASAAAAAPAPAEDAGLRTAVEKLLAEVAARWRTLDTPALESLWDHGHPPLYVAEESTEIHTSFESLRAYWTAARDSTLKMGLRLGRPEIVPLGADLVTAMYPLHWECVLKGQTTPIGGDNRAFSVLRHVDGQWRFTQYIEAPLAPLVYMQHLYEQSVTPGFGRGG